MNQYQALKKAIETVGSQSALARFCGIRQQTVSDWLRKFKRVPAERVIQVEKATKGRVTRYELRPDIYPRDEDMQYE